MSRGNKLPKVIADLHADPRNPREIDDAAATGLMESLSTFGDIAGITFNLETRTLVAGHQRVRQLIAAYGDSLGIKAPNDGSDRGYITCPNGDQFAVRFVKWSQDRQTAANVAANNPMIAGDFTDGLGEILAEMQDSLGEAFEGLRFDALMSMEGIDNAQIEEDEVPEAPAEAVTRPGEWIVLGDHRLLCADSTDLQAMRKLVDLMGEKAILTVTSPPYWCGKEYERESTNEEIDKHIEQACEAWSLITAEHGRICINTGTAAKSPYGDECFELDLRLPRWQNAMKRCGWSMRGVRIWTKDGPPLVATSPSVDLHSMYWEFLATFYRPTEKRQIANRLDEPWILSGLWNVQPQTQSVGHSAPFPVELPSRFIRLYSTDGQLIFDPYLGSGTTLIAAEQLGRRCCGMEIEPRYCDVIAARWEALTGRQAERFSPE